MATISFAKLTSELKALYAPPMRAPATWAKLRQVLAELAALDDVTRSSDLTAATIGRWIAKYPDRTAITTHSLLRSMRAAASYAVMMGYLKTDPFAWRTPALWLPICSESENISGQNPEFSRALSCLNVMQILTTADTEARQRVCRNGMTPWMSKRLRALVYVYAYTGMRKREALCLLRSDVNLSTGFITIRGNSHRRLKTAASSAPLAIAPALAIVLKRWLPRTGCEWVFPRLRLHGPWLHGGPGKRPLDQVRDLGLRAGVPGLTILAFRHTLATLAEGWGLGELELQRWLRHTRRRTQDAYRRRGDLAAIAATAGKIRFAD